MYALPYQIGKFMRHHAGRRDLNGSCPVVVHVTELVGQTSQFLEREVVRVGGVDCAI